MTMPVHEGRADFEGHETWYLVVGDLAASRAGIGPAPLVTHVEPLQVFYEAEPEHHDYFARNPWTGYCQAVVAPKVAKFRKTFSDRLKRAAAE